MADEKDRKNIAHEINMLIGECIQDIRNLSKVFISKQVRRFGFVESLEREIFRIERLKLMDVEYKIKSTENSGTEITITYIKTDKWKE